MFHRKRNLRVRAEEDLENLTMNDQDDKKEGETGNIDEDQNERARCDPKFISRVFSEDYQNIKMIILDPQSSAALRWNKIFLIICLLSLFIDPLFLYSPYSTSELCIHASNRKFDLVLSVMRSVLDVFYIINIIIQFRTAYVAPSSRVLGRGELVIDPWKIALRYLHRDFWIDAIAMLPVPQIIMWAVIPNQKGSATSLSKTAPRCAILLQLLLRFGLLYPLSSKISKATGAMPKTAWIGVAYNIMLDYLLSNVGGASYYLLTLQRQESCWRSECDNESPTCNYIFFDCRSISTSLPERNVWMASTNVTNICNPYNNFYQFGIFQASLQVGATSAPFFRKLFFCFWWTLQQFCSIGNNLTTSSNVVENIFTNLVAIVGILLFASLVGNVETYIESVTIRVDKWRMKRAETERWMQHRQLDPKLRKSVRNYDEYKWVATRGVDEEDLLRDLPPNLRRKVNRHLWFNLLKQVPLFKQMDDHMLDAICERLKPVLATEDTVLLHEGDPVTKMLFIIRGNLDSYTTSGGRPGFLNSSRLSPGNFCGEELLTWALDPHSNDILPNSTRTVKPTTKVEALALTPNDLKYIATKFRKLRSREVVHNFRFHSHQWRTWGACYIQASWRRYKRRKELLLAQQPSLEIQQPLSEEVEIFLPQPGSGLATYAAELVRRIRRGSSNRFGPDSRTIGGSVNSEIEEIFVYDK